MADKDVPSSQRPSPTKRPRDIAHIIKYILLFLLLLLLFAEMSAGEYNHLRLGSMPSLVLLLKLLLIAILIALIRVQKSLRCELTAPSGCTEEVSDPIAGKLFIRVFGTAAGGGFGSYTLQIFKGGDLQSVDISYPGGGGSGISPVYGGELGQITTTSLSDGGYDIVLTVYPSGSGSPKTCTISFNLLKIMVYINRVAKIPVISMSPTPGNPNPFDEAAELRLESGSFPPRSVGGLMSMDGAAYIYECSDRRIKNYTIRYDRVLAPGTEPSQPAPDTPIPPAFSHTVAPLPLEYISADYYQPWNRVGMAPRNLINSWKTMTIGSTTFYKLNEGRWNSGATGSSGRYSLLLSAEDTAGHRYHDIQHIWLDNEAIHCKIVKFKGQTSPGVWVDIPQCEDISMAKYSKLQIIGIAWDPIIDTAWWPPVAPNDNFGKYVVTFKKQFGSWQPLSGDQPDRVPALPAAPPVSIPLDSDADVLCEWDLSILDAGPAPSPYTPPADPKLYRKESCTYDVQLYVTDKTVVNESTTHEKWNFIPIKIINDL